MNVQMVTAGVYPGSAGSGRVTVSPLTLTQVLHRLFTNLINKQMALLINKQINALPTELSLLRTVLKDWWNELRIRSSAVQQTSTHSLLCR